MRVDASSVMPLAPTGHIEASGYLVAFDGTWNDAAKSSIIYRFYRSRYEGNATAYYPGVGAACGPVGRWAGGLLGLGAGRIVVRAAADLAAFYRGAASRDVPVDIIGYSRGAFQAVRLARRLVGRGIDVGDPAGVWFRPRVRFVGLVSPVGQMGTVFSRLDPGWAKALPAGVGYAFQLLASNPRHPLFLESTVDVSDAATSACPPRSGHGHIAIGWAGDVLAALADHARRAGAPVRS